MLSGEVMRALRKHWFRATVLVPFMLIGAGIYEPLDDGILVLMVTRGARHYASILRRRLRL